MALMHLPPLAALRAFEATARLGGFSQAGRELNVTPAAVNQQVRGLEKELAVTLVTRVGRGIVLTSEGQELARDLAAGFARIRTGIDRITDVRDAAPLKITMTPSFASNWFMPRYADFQKRHPDVQLILNPTAEVVPMRQPGYDVAIRFGHGEWEGLEATPLLESPFVIVGAPSLVEDRQFDDVADLARLPWFSEVGSDEVHRWLTDHGAVDACVDQITEMPGNLILGALRDGLGVAGYARAFLEDDLRSGRLRVLWQEDDAPGGYYLVHRPEVLRPGAAMFKRWILRAAAAGSPPADQADDR
ncbi:MAG: LysR family transcriptional regulator [Pseudomonadota bacterium]